MSKDKPLPAAVSSFYAFMLGPIRDKAKELGYAIAVHGSLQNDLDLIAVPWDGDAVAGEQLVEAVRVLVGAFIPNTLHSPANGPQGNPRLQVHGRKCWTICFGGSAYIDFSVMPRVEGSS